MNTIIPITEARKDIFKIIAEVSANGTRYLLTEKGHAKAVILSAEEFDSWQETLDVMRDFPTIQDDIKKAHAELKAGDTITFEELLAEQGLLVADKERNVLSNRNLKRSPKGTK